MHEFPGWVKANLPVDARMARVPARLASSVLVVAVSLTVLAAMPMAQAASDRGLRLTYLATLPGDVAAAEVESSTPGAEPSRLGGVRIGIWPEETSLDVAVQDPAGIVAARWLKLDAAGAPIASGRFCGATTLSVGGVNEVWILPSLDARPCSGGPATRGTVVAKLSPSLHTYPRNPLPNDGWLHGLDRFDACAILLHDVGASNQDRTTKVCEDGDIRPDGAPSPDVNVGACSTGYGGGLDAFGTGASLCSDLTTAPGTPPGIVPSTNGCPQYGLVLEWLGGAVGLCADAGVIDEFGECEPQCFWYSLTQCGAYEFDPTVYALGITVYACGTAVADPPAPGGVGTSPCPTGVGAGVTIAGGPVRGCLRFDHEVDTGWLREVEGPWVADCTSGDGVALGVAGLGATTCAS